MATILYHPVKFSKYILPLLSCTGISRWHAYVDWPFVARQKIGVPLGRGSDRPNPVIARLSTNPG